jgi:lipopolysaccharide assembly outer membrane protein LptD (OstA)
LLKSNYIFFTALFISAFFFQKTRVLSRRHAIELVFAKNVTNSVLYENTTVAKGDVAFKHNETRLFCDSALFFRDKNLVHAYGKVQINQGDTVNLYCDSLKYNGNTKISKLLSNVRFRDSEYLLLTDSLEYNSNNSIGQYKNWATISAINSKVKLTSKKGYYHSQSKIFYSRTVCM